MAQEYPYVYSAGKFKEFLERLGNTGVPDRVNQKFIESLGYKSKNDRRFVAVLRFLGLIDGSGSPTDAYRSTLRGGAQGRSEFARLVRESYADLFSTYPDAQRKDNEALQNFFTAHTDVGNKAVQMMTATFKAVSEFGRFDAQATPSVGSESNGSEDTQTSTGPPVGADSQPPAANPAQALTLNVNVQLELPATSDSGVYNALFAAMAKHIMRLPHTE